MKIAVLMGGTSSEREISLKTGDAVYSALEKMDYQVDKFNLPENRVLEYIPQLKEYDAVFIAYHGGFGENGHVQALLELHDIKFTGSGPLASALGMDKISSLRLFQAANIPVPPGFFVEPDVDNHQEYITLMIARKELSYPLIIKPSNEGSTIGISKVHNPEELPAALEKGLKYSNELIVEQFIAGRELTVAILAGEALPVVEVKPRKEFYDYECKYTKGGSEYICPPGLKPLIKDQLEKFAVEAYKVLKCSNYARVDFRSEGENVYCLEVNTLPGMTSLSLVPMAAKARGVSFSELIDRVVKDAITG